MAGSSGKSPFKENLAGSIGPVEVPAPWETASSARSRMLAPSSNRASGSVTPRESSISTFKSMAVNESSPIVSSGRSGSTLSGAISRTEATRLRSSWIKRSFRSSVGKSVVPLV